MVLSPVVPHKDQQPLLNSARSKEPARRHRRPNGECSPARHPTSGRSPHRPAGARSPLRAQPPPGPGVLTRRRFGPQHHLPRQHRDAIRPRSFIASDLARWSDWPAAPGADDWNRRALLEQEVLLDNSLEPPQLLIKLRYAVLRYGVRTDAARVFEHHGELSGEPRVLACEFLNDRGERGLSTP